MRSPHASGPDVPPLRPDAIPVASRVPVPGPSTDLAPGAGGFALVLRGLIEAARSAPEDRDRWERALRDLLQRNAAYARARARSERDAHYAGRLQELELRVGELEDDLDLTRLRLAEARTSRSAGIPSIYREVQGIAPDDVHRARKQVLIDQLFRANVA